MSWRSKIETQIAALWEIVPTRADGKGFYDDLDGSQANEIDDARQTMQALLDVAVAADAVRDNPFDGPPILNWLELSAALDKLREVGDE